MIRLSIGTTGHTEVDRMLGVSAKVVKDMRPVWDGRLHPFFLNHLEHQFKTSGDHGGAPWAGYEGEPRYRAFKKRVVGHLRPLEWDTGGQFEILRPSLVEPEHEHHVFTSRPLEAVVGTSYPPAARLATGGIGPFGEPFPARRMFAMTRGQIAYLLTEMARGINQQVGTKAARANL